jgi:hypothetical protein
MDPSFPDVSADLDGWQLAEETVETLFQVPGARVRGATRRYEDERTREAVREATDGRLDREWRFVAATGLGFDPPLPPGAASMVLPMVRREAREAFARRLTDRGLADVTRRGEEQPRVGSGARARLTRYGAIDPVEGDVPVTGWVCVWREGGDFFVVTGGHPEGPLADLLSLENADKRLERTAANYREEFVDIVRSVT